MSPGPGSAQLTLLAPVNHSVFVSLAGLVLAHGKEGRELFLTRKEAAKRSRLEPTEQTHGAQTKEVGDFCSGPWFQNLHQCLLGK